MTLTHLPGYTEAFTANSAEVASFKPNQEQFHWNVVNMIRRYIRDSEGEAQGWRQQVTTLIAERSWEKLGFESLPQLVEKAFGMTAEQFLHEVTLHAGPDISEKLVEPHLGSHRCNNDKSVQRQADDAYQARQVVNAPEIAVRLRASDLITDADMRYLGKLNADEAHQETLTLIEDSLEQLWEREGVTPRDRRQFRAQVKGIIQAVAPAPTPKVQSSVVRIPDDAERALAIIQKHLSEPELTKFKQIICSEVASKQPRAPRKEKPLPPPKEALDEVLALADGALAATPHVFVLTGQTGSVPNFKRIARERVANGGTHLVKGNGWVFRKLSPQELNSRGIPIRSSSWEVVEYGEG
ncbi:MAG: hypothetical protein DCO99_03605 [Synechococcus sp. XM-24]|nr:MAG: hypothetical protein DCO99_03605 [Synechococcus sp. XM-24]